ncbi:MAG: nucleotidyltransferase domain-containing protein, partial [Methanoregula sp.]|nr:nucleotidyltransferase domain-containing protein [Methanoregula sp.]
AEAAHFRHKILSRLPGTHFDIQIFQQIPLYVRVEALRGTPVFTRNTTFLYEKATETIRDFNDFKHRLYDYTGQAAIR